MKVYGKYLKLFILLHDELVGSKQISQETWFSAFENSTPPRPFPKDPIEEDGNPISTIQTLHTKWLCKLLISFYCGGLWIVWIVFHIKLFWIKRIYWLYGIVWKVLPTIHTLHRRDAF